MSRAARPHRPHRPPATDTRRRDASAKLRSAFQALHQIRRCLRSVGNLPAFVLHHDVASGQIEWWELLEDERRLRPYDFEFLFRKEALRDRYHADNLRRVRSSRRAVQASLHGFCDLYVPLEIGEAHTLVFAAGQWAPVEPDVPWLRERWRELSGHLPSEVDRNFLRFARCCLEAVVIPRLPGRAAPLVQELTQLAKALARLLGGEDPAAIAQWVAHERAAHFTPSRWDDAWLPSCTDPDGLVRPPWGLDPFPDPKIEEELGLSVRPSAIGISVRVPSSSASKASPAGASVLEELVACRTFQRHAMELARTRSDCVAAPLGEGAILWALGVERAKPAARAKRSQDALQGLLRDLERTLHRLGHPCVGAVGAQVAPGEPLGLSYRTAVAALEQAMATESGRRGSATWTSPEAGTPLGQLMEAQRRAVLAFELHRWTELRTSLTRFALLARSLTGDSHEALGVHVQRLLYALLVVLEDQGALTRERRQALEGLLCAPPSTGDASGVVSHLERQVADLTALLEQGGTADRDARLRLTLQWLESHLTHADPLTEAARRSGLALSSFRREFRRATGTPFAAWLRRRRAESAAQLLRTTSLPVKTIATQVGFKDSHHLIRVFREHFAQTPERYRLQGLQ